VKRTPIGPRKTSLARARLLRRRRRNTPGTADQKQRFKRNTLAAAGWECSVVDDGDHEGELEAHHVTPKEAIKRWARTNHVEREVLADTLWDPANGLAVCGRHHRRHTLARRRIPIAALPAAALIFADALGLRHLIDTTYRKETDDA
jgi:hypothetical protein